MVTNIFTTHGSTASTSEMTSMNLHEYNPNVPNIYLLHLHPTGSSLYLTLSPSEYKLPNVPQHFVNPKTRAARDKRRK